jgi:hypothetical protein
VLEKMRKAHQRLRSFFEPRTADEAQKG